MLHPRNCASSCFAAPLNQKTLSFPKCYVACALQRSDDVLNQFLIICALQFRLAQDHAGFVDSERLCVFLVSIQA